MVPGCRKNKAPTDDGIEEEKVEEPTPYEEEPAHKKLRSQKSKPPIGEGYQQPTEERHQAQSAQKSQPQLNRDLYGHGNAY